MRRHRIVTMDMNTTFNLEAMAHCPKVQVDYDMFHLVTKFGRDAFDRAKVDQANALRDNPKSRQIIKLSR